MPGKITAATNRIGNHISKTLIQVMQSNYGATS